MKGYSKLLLLLSVWLSTLSLEELQRKIYDLIVKDINVMEVSKKGTENRNFKIQKFWKKNGMGMGKKCGKEWETLLKAMHSKM